MRNDPARHAGPPWAAPLASAGLVALLLAFVHLKVPMRMLLLERYLPGWGWLEILALAAYAAWLTHSVGTATGHARWRPWLWRLFSVVFFAQLALGLAGLERCLMTGKLHLPLPALIVAGPIFRGDGFFMPILLASTLLLVGPAWCSHLCYIGAWDDLAAHRQRHSQRLPAWTAWARAGILVAVILTAAGLRLGGMTTGTALALAVAFGLASLAVMALVSARLGVMAHCTVFCPIGLITNLAGRISPFRLRIGPSCRDCGACSLKCRYNALSRNDITARRPGLSCTLCGECLTACHHDSLHFHFLRLSPLASRSLFLVLVISLHASFLGLARI